MEYIIRFVIGGLAVSVFAALGDVLRPKTFAGVFAAAPSIAIATLLLAVIYNGPRYAATEGRSMILGGFAFCAFSLISCRLMKRYELSGLASTLLASLVWLAVAFGLKFALFGAS